MLPGQRGIPAAGGEPVAGDTPGRPAATARPSVPALDPGAPDKIDRTERLLELLS